MPVGLHPSGEIDDFGRPRSRIAWRAGGQAIVVAVGNESCFVLEGVDRRLARQHQLVDGNDVRWRCGRTGKAWNPAWWRIRRLPFAHKSEVAGANVID